MSVYYCPYIKDSFGVLPPKRPPLNHDKAGETGGSAKAVLGFNQLPYAKLLQKLHRGKEGGCNGAGGTANLQCAVYGAAVLDFFNADTQQRSSSAESTVHRLIEIGAASDEGHGSGLLKLLHAPFICKGFGGTAFSYAQWGELFPAELSSEKTPVFSPFRY